MMVLKKNVEYFKHPRLGQPVNCFTVVSMESLKR